MSRLRKKIQSSDQDQVSIFDSEEQHPTHNSRNNHKLKMSKVKEKTDRKPGRKPSAKNIEKKLNREEENIMKSMLGAQHKHKHTPTIPKQPQQTTPNHNIDNNKDKKETYQPIAKKSQVDTAHPKISSSTLDTDSTLLETELTWLDLQDVTTILNIQNNTVSQNNKSSDINRGLQQQISTEYSIDQYQLNDNHIFSSEAYSTQPDNHRYTLNYKRTPRKQYSNPYYTNPRFNQYKPQYQYQPQYNNYDYPSHPRSYHNRTNYNNYRQTYAHNNRYDDYSGYGYHPYQNKYSLYPSEHIISQAQQAQVVAQKKVEEIKLEAKYRKQKVLQQIQRLKQQFKKLQDQSDTQQEHHPQQPIKQQTSGYSSSKLWKYEPIPQPFKYVPPPIDSRDAKYQKSKTEDRIIMIDIILRQNPFLTQFEMAEVLRALDPFLNARIERSVVLRLLKMSGYKKKKIIVLNKDRNSPQNLNLRKQFAFHYRSLKAENYSVAYYDQLIINEYYDKEAGWCKQHEEVDARLERFMNRSLVVIAVLSTDGICSWEARFGTITDEQYCKIMSKVLKKAAQDQPKKVLIANQVAYRRPDHLQEIAGRRNWRLSVLPKQSIYLNPLQFYFSEVKERLKKRRFQSLQGMFKQAVECLKECDRDEIVREVVSKIETFIDKAIQKECF